MEKILESKPLLLSTPNVELDAIVVDTMGVEVVGVAEITELAEPVVLSYVEVERVK